MRASILLFSGCLTLAIAARADVAPVAVRVVLAQAWIGQRVPLFVELRARGSFSGTASFDLPQLPGTLLMKIGAPVVSSQNLAGESWFVQTHEFALFSQQPGLLEMPPFPVRFASRSGFTGPATDVEVQAPGCQVEIQRPPGSDALGFLITTESLDIAETWEPQPGSAQVGAIFKRHIVQRAAQVAGMALAAASTTAPDGICVYPGAAETKDQLERGDFLGERRETITYLLQKPGTLTLPALAYVWWNPRTAQLESKTLPAVTFEVTPAPAALASAQAAGTSRTWPWLLAAALVVGLSVWQVRRVAGLAQHIRRMLNPPDRVAARHLLRACRHSDAPAAQAAWTAWRNTQGTAFQPGTDLRCAVLGLQQHLFGPTPAIPWRSDELARAFSAQLAAARVRSRGEPALALPPLNPPEGASS